MLQIIENAVEAKVNGEMVSLGMLGGSPEAVMIDEEPTANTKLKIDTTGGGTVKLVEESDLKTRSVDTGIDGITAYKSGNTVCLNIYTPNITSSQTGIWCNLGQLPTELRPIGAIYFNAYDNSINQYANNTVHEMRIDDNGCIFVWAFPDKTTIALRGSITYIV